MEVLLEMLSPQDDIPYCAGLPFRSTDILQVHVGAYDLLLYCAVRHDDISVFIYRLLYGA